MLLCDTIIENDLPLKPSRGRLPPRTRRENPEWKEAVRALILGEELLQLPTRFNAFVDEQRQVNKRVESDISDLKKGQARLEEGQAQLQAGQRRIETRMDRQENDSSVIKDFYMGTVVAREAETLPGDFGLEYVRTLNGADLDRMIRAARADLPLNERRSFLQGRPRSGGQRRIRHRLHRPGGLVHRRPARFGTCPAQRSIAHRVHRPPRPTGRRQRPQRERGIGPL